MRNIFGILLFWVAACVPPKPVQLGPVSATTPRPVAEIVQAAARSLASDGFEITVSDAIAGIVTAKRVRAKTGNAEYVKCRYAKGSIGETNMETALTLTVTARSGVAVITNTVRVTMPGFAGTSMQMVPSDDDCASTGIAESHVSAALKGS